jgi:hypothetical protein
MMRPLVVTTPAAYVKLTASDDSRISGAPVTMVHLNASTKTSIHDYPDGSGFEYQFSVTPPQGVAVTQPMPHMTMLSGSTPGYSLSHGAMWTPPTVPGKYVVTVKTKALGPVSAANPVKSDSLSFIVTGPAIAGATSTTPSGIFKAGSAVNVTVTFNQPVSSTGLSITLNDGAILKTGALANATSFSGIYTVAAGQNIAALNVTSITGTITDAANNKIVNPAVPAGYNISNSVKLVIDTIVPTLTVQAPLLTHTPTITVSGKTSDTNGIKSLTVNGKSVAIGYGGTFSTQVTMSSVFNKVTTIATDKAGNVTTEVRNVIFK